MFDKTIKLNSNHLKAYLNKGKAIKFFIGNALNELKKFDFAI